MMQVMRLYNAESAVVLCWQPCAERTSEWTAAPFLTPPSTQAHLTTWRASARRIPGRRLRLSFASFCTSSAFLYNHSLSDAPHTTHIVKIPIAFPSKSADSTCLARVSCSPSATTRVILRHRSRMRRPAAHLQVIFVVPPAPCALLAITLIQFDVCRCNQSNCTCTAPITQQQQQRQRLFYCTKCTGVDPPANNNTMWVKKQDALLVSITSQNIKRFPKFFHCLTQHKICDKMIITYPTTPQRHWRNFENRLIFREVINISRCLVFWLRV